MLMPDDYTGIDSNSIFIDLQQENGNGKIIYNSNDEFQADINQSSSFVHLGSYYNTENNEHMEINPFEIKSDDGDNHETSEIKTLQASPSMRHPLSRNKSIYHHSLTFDGSQKTNQYFFNNNNPFVINQDDPDIENKPEGTGIVDDETKSVMQQPNQAELKLLKIQADLEKRMQELEQREKYLFQRETKRNQGTQYPPPKNWPPFPKWTHLTPCFHQSISEDIPIVYQETVKRTYYSWLLYVVLMICNLLVGLIFLFVGLGNTEKENNGKEFGLSLLYIFMFIPTSYTCWFRALYKACKTDSSIWFMAFFLMSFCQVLLTFICFLGINGSGFFGLIIGISQFTCDNCIGKNYFIGSCMVALGTAFACCGSFQCYIAIKINKLYTRKEIKPSKEGKNFKKTNKK